MIKIFNVRDGFANNSSSTHSIIFRMDQETASDNYSDDFGWDYFTVNSKNGINEYLAGVLSANLSYELGNDYIKAIVESWTDSKWSKEIPTVDHQSCIILPLRFDGKGINKQFFDEIREMFLSNNTLILGGNDNDDNSHFLSDTPGLKPAFRVDHSNHDYVAKYDNEYQYWTLFDRNTGFKMRCILNENGEQRYTPKRSSTPDLVDVSVTNFCNSGCQFCYMGSTKDGNHAELAELQHIISTLSHHETFEIAFGGGEPTQYPDFIELLKYTRSKHIVPNFTTKNLEWLKNNIGDIAHTIGSCAVSVQHATEIKRIKTITDFYSLSKDKICAQIVVGAYESYIFESIVKECIEHQVPLTLLGFKTTGRGQTYKKKPCDDWFDIVKKHIKNQSYYKIGIDTALVQQYEDLLKKEGVPDWLYHKDEGKFSWYVNAADKTMGKSSYDQTTPYKHFASDFIKAYQA